eukprot:TRINITY_DN40047_c0_g1_i1.p1 TRINITY_DN40047_c0_g1~~TRINITY_DN40047_c0_g1_i1.p1  ORF type:complete len:797 (+),score=251.87 TRINITY_DN40047_c0_g1_i1:68-2458(+)
MNARDPVFYCAFVATKRSSKPDAKSEVPFSYPIEPAALLKEHPCLTDFCFPEVTSESAARTTRFTFTLTHQSGTWLYGFCVRACSRAACLCILSARPWWSCFYEVLGHAEWEYACGKQPSVFQTLYHSCAAEARPGSRIHLACDGPGLVSVSVPSDLYPMSDRSLSELFAAFGVSGVLKLFAATLEERRVLLSGTDLDILTSCAHGLTALLHPLRWVHVFIPILPPKMLDAICSPTPYIIGIHSELLERAATLPTDAVVHGDVVAGKVISSEDLLALPTGDEMKSKLKSIIEKHTDKKGKVMDSLPSEPILTCFVDFFAHCFGRVRRFTTTTSRRSARGGEDILDLDVGAFCESWSGRKRHTKFAEAMCGDGAGREMTQMLQLWKEQDGVLQPSTSSSAQRDVFGERAALEYPDLWEEHRCGQAGEKEKKKKELRARLAGIREMAKRGMKQAQDKVEQKLEERKTRQAAEKGRRRTRDSPPAVAMVPIESGVSDFEGIPRAASPGVQRASPSGWVDPAGWVDRRVVGVPRIADNFPDFLFLHDTLNPWSARRVPPPSPSDIDGRRVTLCKDSEGSCGMRLVQGTVEAVQQGSSAAQAGLQCGDLIVSLNGTNLQGTQVDEAVDRASHVFEVTVIGSGGPTPDMFSPCAPFNAPAPQEPSTADFSPARGTPPPAPILASPVALPADAVFDLFGTPSPAPAAAPAACTLDDLFGAPTVQQLPPPQPLPPPPQPLSPSPPQPSPQRPAPQPPAQQPPPPPVQQPASLDDIFGTAPALPAPQLPPAIPFRAPSGVPVGYV